MTDAVRSYPPGLLPESIRAPLVRQGIPGRGDVVLTTAEDLPREIPEDEEVIPLSVGDRREVLLGAPAALAQLPPGARIGIPPGPGALRLHALIRALHPGLEPVDDGSHNGGRDPVVRPLWPDPALEVRGEVLDPAVWLPAPGQGIAVLRCAPGAGVPGVVADPAAAGILAAERELRSLFPDAVMCCRALAFGDGLRLSAVLLSPDGRQAVRGAASGPRSHAGEVAGRVADLLRHRGADRVAPAFDSSPPNAPSP